MASTEAASALQDATPASDSQPFYDFVGIGFGPAQIAVAIALQESQKSLNALFLDRKPGFSWHQSSHMPRARMENVFIYDLATTRNPRSKFTYVNYLHDVGRIVEFANSDRLQPLREEFEDYLRWCADQFDQKVRYSTEVVKVVPLMEKGRAVKGWSVVLKDGKSGSQYIVKARSVAVPAPSTENRRSQQPLISVNFEAGQRIIAAEDYLQRREELRIPREPRLNIAVVGSSQQSIEILDDLLKCYRLGNVTLATENAALEPLRILNDDPNPPPPRLCSIWARPSSEPAATVSESSEAIQRIYANAYEKKVASKGQYTLRIRTNNTLSDSSFDADVIIREQFQPRASSMGLLQDLDSLVLGCRQNGESLEEVLFKRGAVAEGCRMWMLSAESAGGRTLAKDIAARAGEIARSLALGEADADVLRVSARM